MKRILVLLCLMGCCRSLCGQGSYQLESPERLLPEGRMLFDLRNHPGGTDKMERYKKQSADKDLIQEADYLLACAAFEQGLPGTAEILEQYLDTYPDTRHRDEIRFLLGSTRFMQASYPTALSWLKRLEMERLSPAQQEAYAFRTAYSYLQVGDLKPASDYFVQVRQIGTTYRDAASYYLAYIDYLSGKYDHALEAFTQMKSISLYREQALYYILQIFYLQSEYTKVINSGNELLKSYPDNANNAEVYRLLGNAYYRQGNQNKALEMLSNYVSRTELPLRGDLYLLGVCHYNQEQYRQAAEAFSETVMEEDALTQNACLYLGQSYLKLSDKDKARLAFERAATSDHDKQVKEVAMYNYALLIHETAFSGFGESVLVFEDFLNDFPESQYADKVNDYLAEVYLTSRNYEAALASIDKIAHPGAKLLAAKQNVLLQMGTQAFTNQQFEQAITYFTQTIMLGVYDAEAVGHAYFWRGESGYRQNRFDAAAADFRACLKSINDQTTEVYALAYYNLGYSYFKQQNYSDALTAFRRYLPLEKNTVATAYVDACNRIGDCLFYDRQFNAAEEYYNKAGTTTSSSGDYALYQKGIILGLQKDYQGKIDQMNRLIREYPESPYADDALYEKGNSYVLLENDQRAIETFHTLMVKYPRSSFARKSGLRLGLLYFNNNQPEKSVEAYKQVVADYPGSEEAKVALQDLKSVYMDLNDVSLYAAYVNSLGENAYFEITEQDSLTYLAAEKLFLRGDNYEEARRSLQNYLHAFPQGAFSLDATFYLAKIAFSRKNYAEAKKQYDAILSKGENAKFREEAFARKAEIEYMEKDYAAAMQSFKQLHAIAELPENREAARLGLMRCAYYTNRPEEVIPAATDLLRSAKRLPETETEALYMRAKSYIALNEYDKAEDDLRALSRNLRTVHGAEAKYLLARIYFDNNEINKAEAELKDFIDQGTNHAYWLAQAFILLADIYILQGDDFMARQYLISLQKNYRGNDHIDAMIEERLAKLKK